MPRSRALNRLRNCSGPFSTKSIFIGSIPLLVQRCIKIVVQVRFGFTNIKSKKFGCGLKNDNNIKLIFVSFLSPAFIECFNSFCFCRIFLCFLFTKEYGNKYSWPEK